MWKRARARLGLSAALATIALLSGGTLDASMCGVAGGVAAGAAAGGTGYVILFSPSAPFAYTGAGAATLGTAVGDACMDIWRDSTLGEAPPNFNAVYAAGPAACSVALCSGTPMICGPVTFCLAFP